MKQKGLVVLLLVFAIIGAFRFCSTSTKADKIVELLETPMLPIVCQQDSKINDVETLEMVYKLNEEYVVTAYCACSKCCGKENGITASGVKATEGVTIAADTNKLPFGTRVYIEDVGERVVQDRGGAIKGNRIDLYFSDHQSALNFGRQTKKIAILN